MPGAATGLADVAACHPHPLEVLRRLNHAAQQLAVLGLHQRSLAQGHPCFGDAVGECVTHSLQLAQVEHPRLSRDGGDPVLDLGVTEGLAEEPRQLGLEPGDLLAQLRPREALVDLEVKPGKAVSFK
ncbi:MAG TPA: hypothetical protein VGO66_02720 [Solirubrobacterales bacterium]|nr:hypothetical protein [Solirubrobacterales bacterium]